MNRKEIIDAIALESGLTKRDTDIFLDSFIKVVCDTLEKGDKVNLFGFGSFEVRTRETRNGRNPHTGEKMVIKGRKLPAFKAGAMFKERVNRGN